MPPNVESAHDQSVRVPSQYNKSALTDLVSDIYLIFGLIGMLELNFTTFREKCPVMQFEATKLIGPGSRPAKKVDFAKEFPGTTFEEFQGKTYPSIRPELAGAADIWSFIKETECHPFHPPISFLIHGLCPKIFYHDALKGQNQRIARRTNNCGTVLSLLYHILDAGLMQARADASTKIDETDDKLAADNLVSFVKRMSHNLQAIGEEQLWLFRSDAYYDAAQYQMFISTMCVLYIDTCIQNNISLKEDCAASYALNQSSNTGPTASQRNALRGQAVIEDELLIAALIMGHPQQAIRKVWNSSTLRRKLKNMISHPAKKISKVLNDLQALGLITIETFRATKTWFYTDFNPTLEVWEKMHTIFFGADYTAIRSRFSRSLPDLDPSIVKYFAAVKMYNQHSILNRMACGVFEHYIKGKISWKRAVSTRGIQLIQQLAIHEWLVEGMSEESYYNTSCACKTLRQWMQKLLVNWREQQQIQQTCHNSADITHNGTSVLNADYNSAYHDMNVVDGNLQVSSMEKLMLLGTQAAQYKDMIYATTNVYQNRNTSCWHSLSRVQEEQLLIVVNILQEMQKVSNAHYEHFLQNNEWALRVKLGYERNMFGHIYNAFGQSGNMEVNANILGDPEVSDSTQKLNNETDVNAGNMVISQQQSESIEFDDESQDSDMETNDSNNSIDGEFVVGDDVLDFEEQDDIQEEDEGISREVSTTVPMTGSEDEDEDDDI